MNGWTTETSSSCSRAAPAPKSDTRPKAITHTRASWRFRTIGTRLKSCALKPWAKKRPKMRCTNGCCRCRRTSALFIFGGAVVGGGAQEQRRCGEESL